MLRSPFQPARKGDDLISHRFGASHSVPIRFVADVLAERHMPAFMPALDLLWEHVLDTQFNDIGRCCSRRVAGADRGGPGLPWVRPCA
jgi:hypothetical protein